MPSTFQHRTRLIAGLAGFLALVLDALTTHLWQKHLVLSDLDHIHTALQMLLTHALLLAMLSLNPLKDRWLKASVWLIQIGMISFSGGIMLTSLGLWPVIRPIIPIGGTAYMLAWLALAGSALG